MITIGILLDSGVKIKGCYILQTDLQVESVNEKYHIRSPRGIIVLNGLQYKILKEFKEGVEVEEVINKYLFLGKNSVERLIDKYIFEKLIIIKDTPILMRKTFGYYFRKLTKFNLPSAPLLFVIDHVFGKINIKKITGISLILIFISIYTNNILIYYTHFSWVNMPRLLVFILIGVFVAFYHELWIATFIANLGGRKNLKFKLRFLLGFFISIVVNWQYLLGFDKKKIIRIFLNVDIITGGICGFFSILGYCAMLGNYRKIAYYLCCFSIIGFSCIGLNLYPFFLKNDGYNIFCFLTGTQRLRSYWFHILLRLLKKEKISFVESGKLKYYVLWGIMFTGTFIFILYAISKGIRLRI